MTSAIRQERRTLSGGAQRLLAIDTASGQCSVALLMADELIARSVRTARGHAQMLLPMVDEVLVEAGVRLRSLDGIAFGRGPGSFTGVRIAAAVTQGLAAGAGLPVLPISDLRALAEGARLELLSRGIALPEGRLIACMDARMGEVYWGLFEHRGVPVGAAIGGERVSSPAALPAQAGDLASAPGPIVGATGMGLGAYPELVGDLGLRTDQCFPDAEPGAALIAQLAAADLAGGARWQDPAAAQPVYLRDKVIQVPL